MGLVLSVGDERCGGERMIQELPKVVGGYSGKTEGSSWPFNGFGLDCRREQILAFGGLC